MRRRGPHRGAAWTALAIAGAAGLATPGVAKERLIRPLGAELGTPPQYVAVIEQDPAGYLWLGTAAGLLRYDGVELRRWAPSTISEGITRLAVGPDGDLYAAAREAAIYRITASGAEPVPGPDGGAWRETRRIEVDTRGQLWVITLDGRVYCGSAGSWRRPVGALEGERPRVVRRDGDGVLLATFRGVWRVDAGDRLERLVAFAFEKPDAPVDLLRMPDGAVWVGMDTLGVWEYRGGEGRLRARPPGRGHLMARRGDTVWMIGAAGLVAIPADGPPEFLPATDANGRRGTAILVDREGSLWVGGSRGAFLYPEPDTVAWNAGDGLWRGVMRLARTAEGLWVTAWGDRLAMIEGAPEGLRARALDTGSALELCVTGAGTLWGAGRPAGGTGPMRILSKGPGLAFRFHGPPLQRSDCRAAPDGGVWFTTDQGLYHATATDLLSSLGPPRDGGRTLHGRRPLEDSRGALWLIAAAAGPPGGSQLCRAPAAEIRSGLSPSFACVPLGDVKVIEDLVETPSGAIWLGTRDSGVLRYDGRRLETLPGSRELPSTNVHVLEPARDGGFWVSGAGYLWRVLERPDLAEGWDVVERLGPANGIMADGAFGVVEDEDGALWATTAAGVIRVPASARAPRPAEPRPHLQRVLVNGRPVDPGAAATVPYGHNEVALEISALLFRDPSALRYRIRLNRDAPWSTPSRASRVQLVDVPSGRYRVEVSASGDGVMWTQPAAIFEFGVATPWHRRPAVWVLAALAGLGLATGLQRLRLAGRVRLERQRAQIALDLHDEMGSGLGSIRLLAGLAARETASLEARTTAAGRIEGIARDLGQALTAIVWSLRDGGRTLRDLCGHLAERGYELFPDEAPAFTVAFPASWPPQVLSLPTRRNLQLILLEALHNAAKHAGARRVVFGVAVEDARWRLWVEDDGAGLPRAAAVRTRGQGLGSMAARASDIGATLRIGGALAAPAGTRVELVLPAPRPASVRRRPWRIGALKEAWRTSRS